MRTQAILILAAGWLAGAAAAQTLEPQTDAARENPRAVTPAPEPPGPPCPPSGFAPTTFGTFGDNDGVLRAYEAASPCIPAAVRKAATAIGMGRFNPVGVKNVTTIRFKANGTFAFAGEKAAASKVDASISYVLPAARFAVEREGAKPSHVIKVFSGRMSWTESTPGVDRTAGGDWRALAPLLKLTPFGAMWSLIDAEGKVTVATIDGRTTIVGASPYDGELVTVTLDAQDRPAAVEVVADGVRYGATFEGYSDKWESQYLNIFPARMRWTRNGRPLANLEVVAFHSNPYIVFPPPPGTAKR